MHSLDNLPESRPLKIAFFIDALGWGGAEKSLISLLRGLDLSNFSIYLFTLPGAPALDDVDGMLPSQVSRRTVPVCRSRLYLRFCQLCYSAAIRLLPRLHIHKHLAEVFWRTMNTTFPPIPEEYDVAVSYQQGFMTYYVAEKVSATRKIAWINSQLSGHGHSVRFSRKYYDRYHHVVAVCHELSRLLASSGYVDASRLTTIYDIVDTDEIRAKAMEECDIDRTRGFVIVTVARLAPEKNLPLAIEAAAILKALGVDFIWYIVGEGIEEGYLRSKIAELNVADHVVLTGSKLNPYPYMKAADIYVQTSLAEGYGLTITEAKILGRPVVSTDFPIIYDQIRHRNNGLIVQMTPESVASGITTLLTDESLRKSIEKNLAAETNLTSVNTPRQFLDLISDLQ